MIRPPRDQGSREPGRMERLRLSAPPPLSLEDERVRQLIERKWTLVERLFGIPNVAGVGVGHRIIEREGTVRDEPVIRIYVSRKYRSASVLRRRRLPDLRRLPWLPDEIDVVQGRPFAQTRRRLENAAPPPHGAPLTGGSSVGLRGQSNSSGTAGLVCRDDRDGGRPVLLSAWHVLGGGRTQIQAGAEVVSPAPIYTESARRVGQLKRWAYGGTVDAAIASIDDPMAARIGELPGHRVRGLRDVLREGSPPKWFKYGAFSHWTSAYLWDADYSATYIVGPPGRRGRLSLHGLFMLGAFADEDGNVREVSRGGDSGAVWVDNDVRVLGLHVGGDRDDDTSTEYALVCPATSILGALGISVEGA